MFGMPFILVSCTRSIDSSCTIKKGSSKNVNIIGKISMPSFEWFAIPGYVGSCKPTYTPIRIQLRVFKSNNNREKRDKVLNVVYSIGR